MAEDSFAIVLHAIRPHMGQLLSYKISYKIKKGAPKQLIHSAIAPRGNFSPCTTALHYLSIFCRFQWRKAFCSNVKHKILQVWFSLLGKLRCRWAKVEIFCVTSRIWRPRCHLFLHNSPSPLGSYEIVPAYIAEIAITIPGLQKINRSWAHQNHQSPFHCHIL